MASGQGEQEVGIVLAAPQDVGGPGDERLRATVQSLLDQTRPDFEVVVVASVTRSLEGNDPRVRLVVSSETSEAAFWQEGERELRAPWVAFLRPGDQLVPTALEAACAARDSTPGVAAVFGGVEAVDDRGARVAGAAAPPWPLGHAAPGQLLPELVVAECPPLGAMLVDRDALQASGGLDATLRFRSAQDLWLRLLAGFSVCVTGADYLRVPMSADSGDAHDASAAELARIVVRSLRGEPLEAILRALGGGARDAASQGIARTELARRLLSLGRPELHPLVFTLVAEARGVGAYFPGDAPFENLAVQMPELARPDGWFVPPVVEPPPSPSELSRRGTPESATRLRVAIATVDEAGLERAQPLLAEAAAFEAHGVDLIVIHARRHRDDEVSTLRVPTEVLRHPGSEEEAATVLRRREVSAVWSFGGGAVSRVAAREGLALSVEPVRLEGEGAVATLATALTRQAAFASAVFRRRAQQEHAATKRLATARRVEEATLRTLVASLGEAAAGLPRVEGAGELVERLEDARRSVRAASRRGREIGERSNRALDKLRIGRRLATLWGGGKETETDAPVVETDLQVARDFLAGARGAERMWVIYTTDPYSETHGQRSTWLARELLSRGDFVLFFYWRWNLSDPLPDPLHDRLLAVPIDQFYRLQKPLLEAGGGDLEKIFLIEFPDAYLFEQIDLLGAHGFTTVYDCVDDWEEFARAGQAHWYDPEIERHLACRADVVVATHPVLAERIRQLGRSVDVPVVPNGVALDSLANAPARERAGEPVVGYFGHLTAAWFDWELLCETARARPEWSFDIIGHGAPDDLAVPPNVRLRGRVPHEELEAATRSWHVGIVPFRPGRLTQAVDPIKMYEYLALGLPTVVVDMPHLAGAPGVTVCARDGFADALENALQGPLDAARVAAFVQGARWDVRLDALCAAISGAARDDLVKVI